MGVTKEQYEFALQRIEELLPLVDDTTPASDRNAVELTIMSDAVIAYENENYPMGKPTVAQLIELFLLCQERSNESVLLQKAQFLLMYHQT